MARPLNIGKHEALRLTPEPKNSWIAQFLRLANIGHSKSSILNPLQWMTIAFLASILILQFGHPPAWLTILLAILLVLNFAFFASAYFYFMHQRPHSLRSEAFDYKVTELTQKRGGEMNAGVFKEVSVVRELKVLAPADDRGNQDQ